jgi:hypothetical protein
MEATQECEDEPLDAPDDEGESEDSDDEEGFFEALQIELNAEDWEGSTELGELGFYVSLPVRVGASLEADVTAQATAVAARFRLPRAFDINVATTLRDMHDVAAAAVRATAAAFSTHRIGVMYWQRLHAAVFVAQFMDAMPANVTYVHLQLGSAQVLVACRPLVEARLRGRRRLRKLILDVPGGGKCKRHTFTRKGEESTDC